MEKGKLKSKLCGSGTKDAIVQLSHQSVANVIGFPKSIYQGAEYIFETSQGGSREAFFRFKHKYAERKQWQYLHNSDYSSYNLYRA